MWTVLKTLAAIAAGSLTAVGAIIILFGFGVWVGYFMLHLALFLGDFGLMPPGMGR